MQRFGVSLLVRYRLTSRQKVVNAHLAVADHSSTGVITPLLDTDLELFNWTPHPLVIDIGLTLYF